VFTSTKSFRGAPFPRKFVRGAFDFVVDVAKATVWLWSYGDHGEVSSE